MKNKLIGVLVIVLVVIMILLIGVKVFFESKIIVVIGEEVVS